VLTEMVILVQKMMRDVYPELTATGQVIRLVAEEERRFHHTMEVGLEKLDELLRSATTPTPEILARDLYQHLLVDPADFPQNEVEKKSKALTASSRILAAKGDQERLSALNDIVLGAHGREQLDWLN